MSERYTDQELIDRGLLELSPDGHLRTPLPVDKKITIDVSKWDCPTQLDRIESKLDEILVLLTKKKRVTGRKAIPDYAFVSFWSYYPRKTSKPAALRAWNGLNESQKQQIIKVIPDWVDAWRNTDKRFIPHPSTWLNQHRFDDDVDVAVPEEKKVMPKTDADWIQAGAIHNIFARTGESMTSFKRRVEVALR
jgi:hypothetical protein